ncbi:hypothetical protein LC612_31365 [Nostoc sp. CHAB 5834]|nr:hypothetical protein [Nostoc sp. CHAB 5834]
MLIKPNLITALNAASVKMDAASERISTGNRINRASDDPLGFNRMAVTQASISQTGVKVSVLQQGMERLDARDETLSSLQDVTSRFHELTMMASTGLNKLQDIMPEMKALEQAFFSLANSKDASGYMFSGTADTQPFVKTAGVASYAGTTTPFSINVDGVTMSGAVDGTPLMAAFNAMRSTITTMEAGNPPATAQVDAVNASMENLLQMRTDGAAEGAAADQLLNALGMRKDREKTAVDRIRSADPTEEMMKLTENQKLHESVLKVMSVHLNQRRLMDYL